MSWIVLLCAGTAISSPADAELVATARIDAAELSVGPVLELVVEIAVAQDQSASNAGIPSPLLQIDVPDSVELKGRVLTDHKELSRNEFLVAPFERMVEVGTNRIPFTLKRMPQPEEAFGLNVIAYVASSGGKQMRFVRKRLALPIRIDSSSRQVPTTDSAWGNDRTQQIGDQARPFDVPKADGSRFNLSDYLGKQNIIITTYRAHW